MKQKRIDEARALRQHGLFFREIAGKMGVSTSTARNYVTGVVSRAIRKNKVLDCRMRRNGLKCQRDNGHRGIHLSNNEDGKLMYW